MINVGVVTSYATSLKVVGETIVYALNKMGYISKLYTWLLPWPEAKRQFERGIIFIPFDPIYLPSWVLLQRDYAVHGIPAFTYVTVEGIPKQHLIHDWIRRDGLFVANSKYTYEMLQKSRVSVLDVVYHGINMEEIKMAKPYKDKIKEELNGNIVFGTVSTSIPRKGLDKLAEAIKIFSEKHDDARFYILTKQDGAPLFYDLKGVYVDTRYGKLTRTEVLSLIASFDYYLCPSLSEGFCLPIVESQALGVPVIHSEYAPLTEVADPKASYTFPYNEEKWVDLGYGMLFHFHEYDIENMLEQMELAYDTYLNNRDEYEDRCSRAREFATKFDALETYKKFPKLLGL